LSQQIALWGLVRRSKQPLYSTAKPTAILDVAVSMHPRRAVAAREAVSSGGTALGTTLSASAQLRVSSSGVR
jgi:hypothetical protein